MSKKIVELIEKIMGSQISELVRGIVEETLNELLWKEAEALTQTERYDRNESRQVHRSGHYDRKLATTSFELTLHMPRLKDISFEAAIIEHFQHSLSPPIQRLSLMSGQILSRFPLKACCLYLKLFFKPAGGFYFVSCKRCEI